MKRKLISIVVILGLLVSLIVVPAHAATEQEILDSIESGIVWLVTQQADNGSWNDNNGHTGLAVLKLEDRAFELGYDSVFDPAYAYHQNVIDGLNYIFGNCDDVVAGVSVEEHGTTYGTGIAMMAIAGSREPDAVVGALGSDVDGWTYKQVVQEMVDFLVFGQGDAGTELGGWAYGPNSGDADNSNSGYAVLGLQYAEASIYGFECVIPESVKVALSSWIDFIQDDVDGDVLGWDGGSAYATWNTGWVNSLKTGNLLGQMAFVGNTPADQRVQDALDYIERHWYDASLSQGWGWNLPQVQYQAAYCLMKGLAYMGIADDGLDGISDWYMDLADEIIDEQNIDGSWDSSPAYVWPDESLGTMSGPVLSTVWALLTLEKFAPPPPIQIEVEKHYSYTNVCFEQDNDGDGLFNEDPPEEVIDNDGDGVADEDPIDGIDNDGDGVVDEDPSEQIDNDGDGLFNEDDVDCPDGTSLGDQLPADLGDPEDPNDDTYLIEAVVNSKNDKVSSYNPGQYYAVSTVNVLSDVDKLTIEEEWGDCGIGELNPKNGGGKVVIVMVGEDGKAYQVLDAQDEAVTVDPVTGMARVVLEDVPGDTTILMYVKFKPAVKTWIEEIECINYNRAWVGDIDDKPEDPAESSANLMLIAKD
jgi:hypothetical protein